MPSKSSKLNIEMTLYERVDVDILQKLISALDNDQILRNQLKCYYNNMKDHCIPVKYHFSKNLQEKGRLYAENSLSLQNFKKEIRHALGKDFYHDIDMVNAHPMLIMQYCKDNDIECHYLNKYVANRESILKKIQDYHSITRNEAKKLMLRLCYLGQYIIEKEDQETKEISEFEPKHKLKLILNFKNEMIQIAKKVTEIEKDTYELIKNDTTKKNKRSTILSITAQVLEHKCLMAMYDYFKT